VADRRWHWLSSLIKRNKWEWGVELGVMDGKNIAYLCKNNPKLHMYGLDMWQKLPGLPRYDHIHNKRVAELVAIQFKPRVTLIEAQTHDTVQRPDGLLWDFVFIDADHSYEAVKRDILAWKGRTSFLCGHDVGAPGVIRACNELLHAKRAGVDGCWFDA